MHRPPGLAPCTRQQSQAHSDKVRLVQTIHYLPTYSSRQIDQNSGDSTSVFAKVYCKIGNRGATQSIALNKKRKNIICHPMIELDRGETRTDGKDICED
jgi:hypothetical protein